MTPIPDGVTQQVNCVFCRRLLAEVSTSPWKFTCRECKGKFSSTGIIRQPTAPKYQRW